MPAVSIAVDALDPAHQDRASHSSRASTLRPSARLDCELVALRARQLAQHARTAAAQAVMCHDYARSFVFKLDTSPPRSLGRVVIGRRATALEKSNLLAALLRCCDIPARLRMYSVPAVHLRGLTGHEGSRLHPVVEAFLQDRWIATDTYHLDVQTALSARRTLVQERASCGYGLYLRGASAWDGTRDAVNVIGSLPAGGCSVRDWGVFQDADDWEEASRTVHSAHKRSWARPGFWI